MSEVPQGKLGLRQCKLAPPQPKLELPRLIEGLRLSLLAVDRLSETAESCKVESRHGKLQSSRWTLELPQVKLGLRQIKVLLSRDRGADGFSCGISRRKKFQSRRCKLEMQRINEPVSRYRGKVSRRREELRRRIFPPR
jgi:hypothetical protein